MWICNEEQFLCLIQGEGAMSLGSPEFKCPEQLTGAELGEPTPCAGCLAEAVLKTTSLFEQLFVKKWAN